MTPLEFFQIIGDRSVINAIIDNMFIVFFSVPVIWAFFSWLTALEDSARAFSSLNRWEQVNGKYSK